MRLTRILSGYSGEKEWEMTELSNPTIIEEFYDKRGLKIWETNLKLLKNLENILGAKVFFIKQPSLISVDTTDEDKLRINYALHEFDHASHIDAYSQIYESIDDNIAKERIIDLSSINGVPSYFYDHVHPTPEGAERIGLMVAEN